MLFCLYLMIHVTNVVRITKYLFKPIGIFSNKEGSLTVRLFSLIHYFTGRMYTETDISETVYTLGFHTRVQYTESIFLFIWLWSILHQIDNSRMIAKMLCVVDYSYWQFNHFNVWLKKVKRCFHLVALFPRGPLRYAGVHMCKQRFWNIP